MSEFIKLKSAITKQFNHMKEYELFRVQVDKEVLWSTYINSFPNGTNPIFKERTEHDCQCCKSFIRAIGDVVAIIDGKLVSIWDIKVDNFYQEVADSLSILVKSCSINNIFLHTESVAGVDQNYQQTENGVNTFSHFYIKLPATNISRGNDIGTKLGESRSSKDVMLRSLTELTEDSIDTTLELIGQNSLYRGDEHKFVLESFQKLKKEFVKLDNNNDKDIFCWSRIKKEPASVIRIRNIVIGSLLVDISEGKDLEIAVKSFETKVAPTNYKRPTALITKSMIDNAQKTITDLGLTASLERRYANIQDITVNNILFVDHDAKKKMDGNIFDTLVKELPDKIKNLDKVEEVSIETFIQNILPKADSIELLVENRHASNLVSLIAPIDKSAKNMFKWSNNFSWSYTGELADSIKERVKNAGGKIDGDLRCSLSWFNFDDLDLHMVEPDGYKLYFGNKGQYSPSFGVLDVDMNAGGGSTRSPVENICYSDRKKMKEGNYKLYVNNYSKRESTNVGFDIEIEFDGIIHAMSYALAVPDGHTAMVAEIKYSHKNGFEIIQSLPSSKISKNVWNLSTQSFHKTSVVMLSPNHWDDKAVGNKHYFFMLDGCLNDGKARGFFNEFLSEELNVHRKVLEIIGSKMKTEESQNQLSGLGFSSTQRNSILCRVKGSFTRTIVIVF